MPWHRVIIKNSEEAHLSAQGLMIPFIQKYKEAGVPEDVSVYISRDDLGDRIYYFSPNASAIAKYKSPLKRGRKTGTVLSHVSYHLYNTGQEKGRCRDGIPQSALPSMITPARP